MHDAAFGHKETAELLIDNGADVNAKAYDGKTPLHHATKDHEIGIAKQCKVQSIETKIADKSFIQKSLFEAILIDEFLFYCKLYYFILTKTTTNRLLA